MQRVGLRELRQHTGALIERVRRGERLLLTRRGTPVAIISPVDRAGFHALLDRQAADAESLAWLKSSEPDFAFWDNPEDAVWDDVAPIPPQ